MIGSDLRLGRRLQILPRHNRNLLVVAGDARLDLVIPGGAVTEGHQQIEVTFVVGTAFGEHLHSVLDEA